MSQIDYTYFIRDINVPFNAADSSDANYTSLVNSINRYENEILKKLLGYTLWKEYTDAVAASELDTGDEDYVALAEKWTNLRDGADFSFELLGETITTKWNGFLNSDKISLIAYYVYYKHRTENETSYTGLGETKAKGENSVSVSAIPKIVKAWNNMIDLYGEIPYPLNTNKNYYLNSERYNHLNAEPSAYNFLLANIETYDNWIFTPLRKKHSLF